MFFVGSVFCMLIHVFIPSFPPQKVALPPVSKLGLGQEQWAFHVDGHGLAELIQGKLGRNRSHLGSFLVSFVSCGRSRRPGVPEKWQQNIQSGSKPNPKKWCLWNSCIVIKTNIRRKKKRQFVRFMSRTKNIYVHPLGGSTGLAGDGSIMNHAGQGTFSSWTVFIWWLVFQGR